MLYGNNGGGMPLPVPGLMGRRRRKMMTGLGPGHRIRPVAGGGPLDPGMFRQAMQAGGQGLGGGQDYQSAIDHIRGIMQQKAQSDNSVTWGGGTFTDPNKLWGWEQKHGNTMDEGKFWQLHPDAARRLGMPVDDNSFDQANPMDQANLRKGLIGQIAGAAGALTGTPVPGIAKAQQHVANGMMGQHRRIKAVGAAQARAHMLASIMAKRLRGRPS